MKTNNYIKIGGFLVTAIIFIISAFYYLNISGVDTREAKTEMSISTNDFLKEFTDVESASYEKYIDKAIEVKGVLHKSTIKKGVHTLLLKGNKFDTFVLCEMEKGQERLIQPLEEGVEVKVKGIFKGFLKDAILLNCIIIIDAHE